MRTAAATRAAWQSSSRAECRPWSDSVLLSQLDFPRWSMHSRVLRSEFRNLTGNVFEFRQLSSGTRKYDTDTKLDNLTNTKRLLYFYIFYTSQVIMSAHVRSFGRRFVQYWARFRCHPSIFQFSFLIIIGFIFCCNCVVCATLRFRCGNHCERLWKLCA